MKAGLKRARTRLRAASRVLAGRPIRDPRFPAPAVPEGWTVGPPDFVGVGAQKAGTSWWYRLVRAHPSVAHAPGAQKEVHFFEHLAGRPFGPADVARYHAHFPRPAGSVVGEWTPRYAVDYWTPPMLRLAAPDARVLVLLRDPVARYVSGLAHDTSRGVVLSPQLHHDHFARGLYHDQLVRLLEHFPRESVLVLQYEQAVADPLGELARTYRHLSLDPSFVPADLLRPTNKTMTEKLALDAHQQRALAAAYRRDLEALAADFPEVDLSLWPTAAGGSAS